MLPIIGNLKRCLISVVRLQIPDCKVNKSLYKEKSLRLDERFPISNKLTSSSSYLHKTSNNNLTKFSEPSSCHSLYACTILSNNQHYSSEPVVFSYYYLLLSQGRGFCIDSETFIKVFILKQLLAGNKPIGQNELTY